MNEINFYNALSSDLSALLNQTKNIVSNEEFVYVKNKADSYNDLIQNLYKRVEQMQSIWQGVDHLAFQNQLEEFRPSLNEMYQVILEYSNVLKQTASVYEKLQQDRVQQAKLLL